MRAYSIFIVSCLLWVGPVGAQSTLPPMQLAETAFAAGETQLALYYYNRVAYEQNGEHHAHVLMRIGQCRLLLADYGTAARFFDQVYFNTHDDSIKTEAVLLKVRALLGENAAGLALVELLDLDEPVHQSQYLRYYFLRGVCFYELAQFESARQSFLAVVTDTNALNSHFAKPKKFHRPNSTTAMVLSALLPGAGQLYAGEQREALNSLLINSVFIFYSIRIGQLYTPIDALISVIPWFQRYYAGGYNKASLLGYEKMLIRRQQYLREIMAEIERQQ